MSKILWEREMIPAQKREVLIEMGMKQLFIYNTPIFGKQFKELVEASDMIPTDVFYTPDNSWSVQYREDWNLFLLTPKTRIACGIPECDLKQFHNWKTGIEALGLLLAHLEEVKKFSDEYKEQHG